MTRVELTTRIEKVIKDLDDASTCLGCILDQAQANCRLGYAVCPWRTREEEVPAE